MKNYIAAIDLGTTKIVALIGEKTEFERYRILASFEMPSTGIVRGEVENLEDVTKLIQKAVEELREESRLEFSEVYVGIAGQHIRCLCESVKELRDNENETIKQSEIDALQQKMYSVRMEPGEEILHVIPQSYNVDDKMDISRPVGMLGKELTGNYHIVIGLTKAIDKIKKCLSNKKVSLELSRLILEPIASAAAVLNEDDKELGVALVDIGGGTTDLVIYHDHIIRHTAVIPFGGNIVTEDIRKGCGILRRTAELIKVQHGSCLGNLSSENICFVLNNKKEITLKTLSQIIDARMEELLGAVMFEIERSGYADKLQAGIVFTGGGSMFKNFKDFAELKTGLDARIGKPVYLSGDSGSQFAQPFYSTVVGLIIEGIKYESLKKQQERPVLELVPVIPEEPNKENEKKPKDKEGPNIFDRFFGGIFNPDDNV
ncbi:MAG: cell division protein FtsA [Prevotellaceae bacterium]|jgi:cell division protein FtsA|nr:cell division protein FtsA [Prevotellaceae bacterium]